MITTFKSAIYNVVGSFDPGEGSLGNLAPGLTAALPPSAPTRPGPGSGGKEKGLRFPYTRPHFLQLNTEDEVQVTADHAIRPIICPRDISRLPWNTGYAETINAGKSKRNEDQAVCHTGLLTRTIKRILNECNDEELNKRPLLMNGHDNPSEREHTVMLAPQYVDGAGKSSNSSSSTNTTNSDGSTPITSAQGQSTDGLLHRIKVEQECTIYDQIYDLEPGREATNITPEPTSEAEVLSAPYYIFGVFDGHAGWGAAISASNQLHHIIHNNIYLLSFEITTPSVFGDKFFNRTASLKIPNELSSPEYFVTGHLQHAIRYTDNIISEDRLKYQLNGGCTACVALFIKGKLYVANAGDSRCILSYKNKPQEMSFDFTPETETQRVRKLGAQHPELLGGEYTHLDFLRRPMKRDIGKRVLYRDHYMTGWAYKILTQDDLKYPLVCGEGKRSRVLATIGVTRGFGDHDLKAQYSSLPIKPFLSPEPEVSYRIFEIEKADLSDDDVLVLATDGLWDIASNDKVVGLIEKSLNQYPVDDTHRYKYRYIGAAQDLVMSSRGKLRERNWRTSEDKHATIDDISVFVVPLKPYQQEYHDWEIQKTEQLSNEESVITDITTDTPLLSVDPGLSDKSVAETMSSDDQVCASQSVSNNECMNENMANTQPSLELKPQENYFTGEELAQSQNQKSS
ncbi:unnamed protein product, partial [Meganyctiphanes norvegica]